MDRKEFIKNAAISGLGAGLAPGLLKNSLRSKKNKLNIIFLGGEQTRADANARSGFGLDVTPFMDSLARSGVWFDRAYCSSPACVPSRNSRWTGRWPTATGIKSNGNNNDRARYTVSMDQLLKAHGYKMGAIGKTYHSPIRHHKKLFDCFKTYSSMGEGGATDPKIKKFNAYLRSTSFYAHFKPAPFPYQMQQPYREVTDAMNWISSVKDDDEPFFLYWGPAAPHNPYQVSEPYYSMFPPEQLPPLKAGPKTISPKFARTYAPFQERMPLKNASKKGKKYVQLKELYERGLPDFEKHLPRMRSNYYGMLRLIDDQVKRLVTFLKKEGLYKSTVIIRSADHGDYAGRYGLMKKGAGVSEATTRIPMWWYGPGIIQQSASHSAHVSNTDIFPTICDMIGAKLPDGVQGRSLWPLLQGKSYPEEEFRSIIAMHGMGGLDYKSFDASEAYKQGALSKKRWAAANELNSWTQSGVLRMVRMGDWKLIYDMQRRGELYYLPDDPAELHDLYDVPEHSAKRMELLEELLGWELRTQDPLPLPKRYVLKQDPRNYYAPYRDLGRT